MGLYLQKQFIGNAVSRMSTSPWDCFDAIPGCSASAALWQNHLREHFDLFRNAFLVSSAPSHQAFHENNAENVDSANVENGNILQLDWDKLGMALCTAFGLNRILMELPLPATRQIGSWSTNAVPAILTIQTDRQMFRQVICELAVPLRAPFILVGPTSSHMNAACYELLSNFHAEFFSLSAHMLFSDYGGLRLRGSAGDLFRAFTPEPREVLDEDTTRRAFALIKVLDQKQNFQPPTPATVFRLYCIDGLNISEIARKCRCSRGTILNRLKFIQKHTGLAAKAMRRFSGVMEASSATGSASPACPISVKWPSEEPEDESDEESWA